MLKASQYPADNFFYFQTAVHIPAQASLSSPCAPVVTFLSPWTGEQVPLPNAEILQEN